MGEVRHLADRRAVRDAHDVITRARAAAALERWEREREAAMARHPAGKRPPMLTVVEQ